MVFMELLGGFEPPTSSLPTRRLWSNPCCAVLSWHFCPKRMRSNELLCPLNPYGDLLQWVRVWVRHFLRSKRGGHRTASNQAAAPCPVHIIVIGIIVCFLHYSRSIPEVITDFDNVNGAGSVASPSCHFLL